jgi:hypothetical protein
MRAGRDRISGAEHALRRISRVTRVQRAAIVAALIATVCIALRPLLSLDQIPVFRDLLLYIVPIKHFLGAHFRRGEIPLWNPWICLGSPFLAAMHMGVLYPPSVLLILPLPIGFNLFLIVHYLIAVIGMWMVLNDRRLGAASAAVGALTYALGGYLISLLNITKELHGAAWLPWALLFWSRWLTLTSRRDLALTAVALAMQILGGTVESMLMTIALLALVAARAKIGSASGLMKAAAALVLVVGLASALTAFQLIATFEYAAESSRASTLPPDQVFHWSLRPISLLQLVLPISAENADGVNGLGTGLEPYPPMLESLYLGVPALCLALAGIVAGRQGWFWGLILVASIVTALGSSTALLPRLYGAAPQLFGKLRYPEKFLLLFHVSAAVLAAEGLAGVRARARGASPTVMLVAGVLGVTAAAGWWFARYEPERYLGWLASIAEKRPTAIVPVADALAAQITPLALLCLSILTVVALAQRRRIGIEVACLLLVLIEAGDLLRIRWRTLATTSWSSVQSTEPMVDVALLRSRGQAVFHYTDVDTKRSTFQLAYWPTAERDPVARDRMLWAAMFGNVPMVYGVATLGGADGFQRRDVKVLLDVLPSLTLDSVIRLLRTLGVAYLIGPSPRSSPLLEPVRSGDGVLPFVYGLRDASPFAHFARRLDVRESEQDALAHVADAGFDSRSEAVVERLPDGWVNPADSVEESPGDANLVSRDTDRIEIDVAVPERRLLVVNQAKYPGWRATVDGAPTEILRANGLVQGISIAPGRHRLVLEFHPSGFRWGCAVASAAGLFLAFLAATGRGARRVAA